MPLSEALIEAIYEGPIERDAWSSFLHDCRISLRSSSALMMFRTPSAGGEFTDIADADWQTHAMSQIYYRQYAAFNPLDYDAMDTGRTYGYEDFIGAAEFRQSPYYRNFCRPQGLDHALVLYVGEADGLRAWLNFSRSDDVGRYTLAESAQLLALGPHLHRALRIYAALERRRLESLAYRRTGDSLRLATLLLDEHGRVSSMNESASVLLAGHPNLRLKGKALYPIRPDDRRLLDMNLRQILDGSAETDCAALIIGALSGRPVSLLMRRMPRVGMDLRHPGGAAVIYLQECGLPVGLAKAELVATLFGLTPTESRLAVMLAEGESLREIAANLGIAELTARTYSKRIFAKTGASRQSDLVRLILTSLAMLGS